MDSKSKNIVSRRINLLFCLFFIFVAAGVFFSSSSRGFRLGWNDTENMFGDPSVNTVHSNMIYGVKVEQRYDDFSTPLHSSDSTVVAFTRPSSLDVKVQADRDNNFSRRHSVGVILTAFVALLSYVAVYVLLFVMLLSLSRSMRHGELFQHRNIVRTRVIGFLLIVASVSQSLCSWLNNCSAVELFRGTQYVVDTSFRFDFGGLITALMILFIGEVFAIGYNLSEEQKLTI